MLLKNMKHYQEVSRKEKFACQLIVLTLLMVIFTGTLMADDSYVAGGKKDKPVLTSIVVTPENLQGGKDNQVTIVFKFQDNNRDLKGGKLLLFMCEDDSTCTTKTFDLGLKRFGRKSGKGKIKSTLTIGQCQSLKIEAWLEDAALNRSKKIKLDLDVEGKDLPPFGTKVGMRAQNFTLKNHKGKKVSLHDFAGSIILLNFSAEW